MTLPSQHDLIDSLIDPNNHLLSESQHPDWYLAIAKLVGVDDREIARVKALCVETMLELNYVCNFPRHLYESGIRLSLQYADGEIDYDRIDLFLMSLYKQLDFGVMLMPSSGVNTPLYYAMNRDCTKLCEFIATVKDSYSIYEENNKGSYAESIEQTRQITELLCPQIQVSIKKLRTN